MVDSTKSTKITVLGSANYDIFIKVARSPQVGETISSSSVQNASGGKGANQAFAVGRLGNQVDFIGQFGLDSSGDQLIQNLNLANVNTKNCQILSNEPTGQAFILSYPDGNNSIIIVGGANMNWNNNDLSGLRESLKSCKWLFNIASVLLMQREIPEEINIKAAQYAKELSVKVILDYGGADIPISNDLLRNLDIISPNETELKRILNREVNINNEKDLISVLKEIRQMSNNDNLELLLKLGSKGSLFISKTDEVTRQKAITIEGMKIVDTTGAGDCFTAAFAVKYVSGKCSIQECMFFASICAFKCITGFGATSSMPKLEEVELLKEKI